MRVVRVRATGRDVRGLRRWSHSTRSGAVLTAGCSGVALEGGRVVLCPLGALFSGWEGVVAEVEGTSVVSWDVLEGRAPASAECVFLLLHLSSPVAPSVDAESGVMMTRQFALHLTQPHWGVISQACRVVCRPERGVALLDVSCYEGGEGGLASGGEEEPMILANGLRADGAPTGLAVAVSIAGLLGGTPQIVSNVFRNDASPIVKIRGKEGRWGTGFSVGNGRVLTAAHVICSANDLPPDTVTAMTDKSQFVNAKVLKCWIGGWLDLCVLQLEEKEEEISLSSFPLSTIMPTVGENVTLVAATQWNGAVLRASGRVIAIVPISQIVCEISAFGGCSGGPLLDHNDYAVGMLVSTAAKGQIRIPKLSLFLPATVVAQVLRNDDAERNDDAALRAAVEPVWRASLPPLPPKFGAFQKSLL